jgi:hypothetical protein
MYEDLRKAVGDDQMSFSFDELLNWAQPLVMVIDHRNTTFSRMSGMPKILSELHLSIDPSKSNG